MTIQQKILNLIFLQNQNIYLLTYLNIFEINIPNCTLSAFKFKWFLKKIKILMSKNLPKQYLLDFL